VGSSQVSHFLSGVLLEIAYTGQTKEKRRPLTETKVEGGKGGRLPKNGGEELVSQGGGLMLEKALRFARRGNLLSPPWRGKARRGRRGRGGIAVASVDENLVDNHVSQFSNCETELADEFKS